MNSLVIKYLSQVLENISYLAGFTAVCTALFLFIIFMSTHVFQEESIIRKVEKYGSVNIFRKLIKVLIISLAVTIFLPTNLDNRVIEAYMIENSKLRAEIAELKTVVTENNLETDLYKLKRAEVLDN